MSSALDLSLDQVISSRKTGRRTSRRGAKSGIVGSTPATATTARPRPRAVSAPVAQTTPQTSDKIIVSNLPNDVNEFQIRELFQTMVGPLREVTLTHDATGRSKGIASVVFVRKGDGSKAYSQYHNRLIDGKRPMKIEMVLDPSKPPAPTLVARVGAAPDATNGTTQSTTTVVGGISGRRGGPRRGRGGGRRRGDDRPAKTVEDLDAEMEDYTGSASAPAAGTAAA